MVEVDSGTLCCEDSGVLALEFSNFDINVTYVEQRYTQNLGQEESA